MRLIDADALETHDIYDGEWVRVVYADDIDNVPTIEAEPVIHCKDCKYCNLARELKHYSTMSLCDWWDELTYLEGYCSFAEKR